MAIEIANLLARISFTVDGAGQAVAAAKAVADELQNLGAAPQEVINRLDHMSDRLSLTRDQLRASREELARLISLAGSMDLGTAVSELAEVKAKLVELEEQGAAALAQLELYEEKKLLGRVNKNKPGTFIGDAEKEILAVLEVEKAREAELEKIVNTHKDINTELVKNLSLEEKVANETERTRRATGDAASNLPTGHPLRPPDLRPIEQGFGRATGKAKGFFRQLMNINNASAFTAYGFARLAGQLTGLGIIITSVIIAFRKFAQAINELDKTDHFAPISAEAEVLATKLGVAESAMRGLLGQFDKQLASQGILNSGDVADQAAQLAADIAPLFGSFEEAFQAVQQAASGSFTELSKAGFVTNRMTGDVEDMGVAYTQAERTIQNLAAVQREAARQQRAINDAANQEITSFADLSKQVRALGEAIATSLLPVVEPIIKFLIMVVQAAKPILSVFGFIIEKFTVLGQLTRALDKEGQTFASNLAKGLEMVARWVENVAKKFDSPGWRAFFFLLGITREELQGLADDFRQASRAVEDTERAFSGFTGETNASALAMERLRTQLDLAKAGFGIGDAVINLGGAFRALEKDASPRNALAYAKAWTSAFDLVAENGIEKLRALRTFINEQFKAGHIEQGVRDSVLRYVDLSLDALAPMEGQVQDLKDATDSGTAKVQTLTGNITDTNTALTATNGLIRDFSAAWNSLNDKTLRLSIIQDVEQRFGTSDVAAPPSAFSAGTQLATGFGMNQGANTADLNAANRLQAQAAASFAAQQNSSKVTAKAIEKAASSIQESATIGEEMAFINAKIAANREAAQKGNEAAGVAFDEFGQKSGGGGRPELDFDAIRKFMQEVNRAIAIASNQGVRVGTAGNAIPFEPGSFVSAEGGNLSVDTILIRGVWDFADPAAKRQIVRELQDALKALQAEI